MNQIEVAEFQLGLARVFADRDVKVTVYESDRLAVELGEMEKGETRDELKSAMVAVYKSVYHQNDNVAPTNVQISIIYRAGKHEYSMGLIKKAVDVVEKYASEIRGEFHAS